MLHLIEAPVKKTKFIEKNPKKKAIKALAKKKAKKIQDAIDGETFSDAEIIPYLDENLSDAETIQYAEPYRDTSKKEEIYRRKAKKKAIEILTKNSREKLKRKAPEIRIKDLPKNSKTDDPIEDVLEITAFKHISRPRTRKRLKEKSVSHANSAMALANIPFDPENFLGVPLLFNLKRVSKFEIEDWISDNFPIGNDELYIEHDPGSKVFTIKKKKQPTDESVSSEMVLNDQKIKLKDVLNMGLTFDLNMTSESEIEDWLLRNFPKNSSKSKYYIEHEKGSDLYVIRSAPENSKLIKELIKIKRLIDPLVYVGVPLWFDLNEIDDIEIEINTWCFFIQLTMKLCLCYQAKGAQCVVQLMMT